MHDPLCVLIEIKRPWSKPTMLRDGRKWRYWPTLVTVWHREPGGHDSGEVCKRTSRVLHVHYWRLQVHPLQHLRRRLLTRCAWCGGRQGKRDAVNHSNSWDGPRAHWWQGEAGLFHQDCSAVARAHAVCVCADPLCSEVSREYGPYGRCAVCGKGRSFGTTPEQAERNRLLASVPAGQRDPVIYQRVCRMVKAHEAVAR